MNLSFLGKSGVVLIGFVFFYHNTLTKYLFIKNLVIYNMKPCWGSLIHAREVLINVDSSIWDSTWEDNFPTSLLKVGTITYDAVSAESWLCNSQYSCDRIAQKSHATCHRRAICAMYGGLHRSPPWNHSYGATPSTSSDNMTPCNTTEVWNLIHPVFHLPTYKPCRVPKSSFMSVRWFSSKSNNCVLLSKALSIISTDLTKRSWLRLWYSREYFLNLF